MRIIRLKVGVLLFSVAFVPNLSGCAKVANRSSILVIAVDRLGVDSVNCSSETPGLSRLCDEGLRFTHAYTTSVLSAPAMGSILTGRYPYATGLRHNGAGDLGAMLASVESVPEMALKNGYRTGFFASSAPFLRRTGLHQGFEIFDDQFSVDNDKLHRPARAVVDLFLQWQEQLRRATPSVPYFAVLQLGDLQFPWAPSLDESGRVRENTVKAQLDEIDSSLARLWGELQKRKLWEKTTIVLVGLQGEPNEDRADEIPASDLHSQMSHVALLIKDGDRAQYQWAPKASTYDANVGLADVGMTLKQWVLGASASNGTREDDQIRSLYPPETNSEDANQDDRFLITESAWAKWRLGAGYSIRVSLRRGPYLFINDAKPLVYNTLTDAYEVSPLPSRGEKTRALQKNFSDYIASLGFQPFREIPSLEIRKERFAREMFSIRLGARVAAVPSLRQSLLDSESVGIDSSLKFWFALEGYSSGVMRPPRSDCAGVVFSENPSETDVANICRVRGAREVSRWLHSGHLGDSERERRFDAVYRLDRQRTTAVRVAEANLALGRIWETGSVRMFDFDGFEMLLAQPEAVRLRQMITRRSQRSGEL